MSDTRSPTTFCDASARVEGDPAVPGCPFCRVRYHYGMLLGAEDFLVEQRARILRHRLHQDLHHGVGTVRGLRVRRARDGANEAARWTRLIVEPGIAVDPVGRDVFVDREQCLDISALVSLAVWRELEPVEPPEPPADPPVEEEYVVPPPGDEESDEEIPEVPADPPLRLAYVVLRYVACESEPVPAVTPPCTDASDAEAYSRIIDRFRIDLAAERPPEPHAFDRKWPLESEPGQEIRAKLLEWILEPAGDLPDRWQEAVDAPLLLAVIELGADESGAWIDSVDNSPRALLPPVQMLAEAHFGVQLTCEDTQVAPGGDPGGEPGDPPLMVESWTVDTQGGNTTIDVVFTRDVNPATKGQSIFAQILKPPRPFDEADVGQWDMAIFTPVHSAERANVVSLEFFGDRHFPNLVAGPNWGSDNVTFQVYLVGDGRAPLMDTELRPLAGRKGDPWPVPGRGRNVSIVDTWRPDEGGGS